MKLMLGLGRIDTHIGVRRLLRRAILLIFLVIRGSAIINHYRLTTDTYILEEMQPQHENTTIERYTIDNHTIRYVDIGNTDAPMVILLHGAPEGISTWYSFLQNTAVLDTFRFLVVDRPGYGHSGGYVTSLERQAQLLAPLLDKNMHTTKPIIIGHSLGPAVGMKMHALYPEKVGGSIHVAGEFSPDDMIIWRVSYPMHTKLLSRAFPRFLRSTNAEKITHPHELGLLAKDMNTITGHVTIMHGNADRIVPVENAYFAEKYLQQAQLDMLLEDDRDHFLPFERPYTIEAALRAMYTSISLGIDGAEQ